MAHRKGYSNEYDKHLNWEDRLKAKVSRYARGKTEGSIKGLEQSKETGAETHKAPKDYWKTEAGKHEADIRGFHKTGPADMNRGYQTYLKEMEAGTHPSQQIESYAQLKAKKKIKEKAKKKKEKEEAKEKDRKKKWKKKYVDK